jgi:Fe-S-cluster-containing dehydrogenase component
MVACSVENNVRPGKHRNWVRTIGPTGTFPALTMWFRPGTCMHCANPPCEIVCPTGATYRRDDGLVEIDKDKCIGCKYCMPACPYNARYFDETRGVVDKCTGCAHRVDAGEEPACAHACMTGALVFGDLNDPTSKAAQLLAGGQGRPIGPATGTQPQIFYIPATAAAPEDHAIRTSVNTVSELWQDLHVAGSLGLGLASLGALGVFGFAHHNAQEHFASVAKEHELTPEDQGKGEASKEEDQS